MAEENPWGAFDVFQFKKKKAADFFANEANRYLEQEELVAFGAPEDLEWDIEDPEKSGDRWFVQVSISSDEGKYTRILMKMMYNIFGRMEQLYENPMNPEWHLTVDLETAAGARRFVGDVITFPEYRGAKKSISWYTFRGKIVPRIEIHGSKAYFAFGTSLQPGDHGYNSVEKAVKTFLRIVEDDSELFLATNPYYEDEDKCLL